MRRKVKSLLIVFLVMLLLGILAVDALLVWERFTWVAGSLQPRDAQMVDLRGKTLTTEEYEKISLRLPGAKILWDVPFQGRSWPSESREVWAVSLSMQDLATLDYFENLTWLKAESCRDYENLMAFRTLHPDCRVTYQVQIGNQMIDNEAKAAQIPNADMQELGQLLKYLPALEAVELTGTIPNRKDMRELEELYPNIRFFYQMEFQGQVLDNSNQEMNLAGKSLDYEEVYQLFASLPELRRVDMRGCTLTNDEMLCLVHAYPNTALIWNPVIQGKTFSSEDEEIDLSGMKFDTAEQVEEYLPCFHKLTRVIMCGCGLDNETMDALNRRYDDIRFIWTVKIKNVELRTDVKWFYPYKYEKYMVVDTDDLYPLRYCVDIEGVDIGHMTTVKNCDWAAFMPNLKYLIIIETEITDLTPLSNLKNLVFLEIFSTKITDYSPLVGCTGLEDLNLGNTYGDPKPILEMTWLKNIWWSGIEGSWGLPASNAPDMLREKLPNTTLKFNLENPNVNNGWRRLENYYRMRDLFDAPYLD